MHLTPAAPRADAARRCLPTPAPTGRETGPPANPGPTPQAGSPPRPRHGPAPRCLFPGTPGRRHHAGHGGDGKGGPAATGRAGPRGAPAAPHLHQPHARVLLGPGEVQLALLAHGGAGVPAEAEDEAGGRCLLLPRPLYQSGPAERRTPGGRWPAVAKPPPLAEQKRDDERSVRWGCGFESPPRCGRGQGGVLAWRPRGATFSLCAKGYPGMLENGSSMQNDLEKLEEQCAESRHCHGSVLCGGWETAAWGAAAGKGVKASPCALLSLK